MLFLHEKGDELVQRGGVLQHPLQIVRSMDVVDQDAEPALLLNYPVGYRALDSILLDQHGLAQLLLGHSSFRAHGEHL